MNIEENSTTQCLSSVRTSRLQSRVNTPSYLYPIKDNTEYIDSMVMYKNNLLQRCKSTIEDLNKELKKEHKKNVNLDVGLVDIKRELDHCKGHMFKKDERIYGLEKINTKLNEELIEVKENIQKLSVQLTEVASSSKDKVLLKSSQDQNKKLLELVNERDKEIKELVEIIEELEGNIEQYKHKNERLTLILEKTQEQIDKQHRAIKKINDDIEKLLYENKGLKEELLFQRELAKELRASNESIMQEHKNTNKKLERLQIEAKSNKEAVNREELEMKTENNELKNKYKEVMEKLSVSENNIIEYKKTIDNINKLKDNLIKELTEEKAKNEINKELSNVLLYSNIERQQSRFVGRGDRKTAREIYRNRKKI